MPCMCSQEEERYQISGGSPVATRNLSPQRMFNNQVKKHEPEVRFSGMNEEYIAICKKKGFEK